MPNTFNNYELPPIFELDRNRYEQSTEYICLYSGPTDIMADLQKRKKRLISGIGITPSHKCYVSVL